MYVLVCTEYRGVFVGETEDTTTAPQSITLTNCRMVIYWGTSRGVLQLAEEGPTAKTIASARAPAITLWKITAIVSLTAKAQQAWEALR